MTPLRIHFHWALSDFSQPGDYQKDISVDVQYDDHTTIRMMLEQAGQSDARLSKYYKLSYGFCANENVFPYIVTSNGKVSWDMRYDETRVVEFLKTHFIDDNNIHTETGIPQAGGPALKSALDLWHEVYSILEQIATVVGLGLCVKEYAKIIGGMFKKERQPTPHAYFECVQSRSQWNHFELAESLDESPDTIRKILRISGFKWDRSKMLYLRDKSDELLRRISEISIEADD